MNKEVKEKWLKALRSGEYKQGISSLCYVQNNEKAYCCLGVLCELAVKESIIPEPIKENYHNNYDGSCHFLPESVMKWANINKSGRFEIENNIDYGLKPDSGSVHLSDINDSRRFSFAQIADIIEGKF